MVRLWLQQEHSQNGRSRSMDGWIWDLEIRGFRADFLGPKGLRLGEWMTIFYPWIVETDGLRFRIL